MQFVYITLWSQFKNALLLTSYQNCLVFYCGWMRKEGIFNQNGMVKHLGEVGYGIIIIIITSLELDPMEMNLGIYFDQ